MRASGTAKSQHFMTPVAFISTVLMLMIVLSPAAFAEAPDVFLYDGDHLAELQASVREQPESFTAFIHALREQANLALDQAPVSVMDKSMVPPSGDKHDYMSLGIYWWPDPASPDGLPYIRHDGQVNPEISDFDSPRRRKMVEAVDALAKGWFFTGETKYAEHAARLVRTWFLDPATRMNPHLEYGQAIPGVTEGRGIGIIDTASLVAFIDSVGLLRQSEAWTESDDRELRAWFGDYLDWLQTSQKGIDEKNWHNNHAVYYDLQIAAFALYTGRIEPARSVLQKVGPRLIAKQIEPDGRMPHELARTKSISYTATNLRGFLWLARMAERLDIDLWSYQTDDGRSIRKALDWFEPFVAGQAEWQFEQITPHDLSEDAILYRIAANSVDDQSFRELSRTVTDPIDRHLWPHEEVLVFVLAGQSNMAGRADVTDQDRNPHPRVEAMDAMGNWAIAREPVHFDKPGRTGVGPALAFGKEIAAACPDIRVRLVPTAVGGSPIRSWEPGGRYEKSGNYPWDEAQPRIEVAKIAGKLAAVLWHQGESDSNATEAPLYATRLEDLIARFRSTADDADLPVLIGQLGQFDDWPESKLAVDRAHREAAAAGDNILFISSDGLGHKGDSLHFDTQASRELGRRYARAYLDLRGCGD